MKLRMTIMLRKRLLRERVKLYMLGALVGAAAGFTAVGFRYLILYPSYLFSIIPVVIGTVGWILAPIIGGLLVAMITVRFAPEAKGHGVPEVMAAYSLQAGKMRMRVPLVKSIASALCISSGGSCGREGPIAQIGSGIGSAIATQLRLGKKERKTLLVCGLSSGLLQLSMRLLEARSSESRLLPEVSWAFRLYQSFWHPSLQRQSPTPSLDHMFLSWLQPSRFRTPSNSSSTSS
jgi:H+/Cl- antiporter ClcA